MSPGYTETIIACNCKGLSYETIKCPTTLGNSLSSKVKLILHSKIAVEYKGSCLKQKKTRFTRRNMVSLFNIYELDTWSKDLSRKFTLGDYCLEQ